jgi:hypothetical protein
VKFSLALMLIGVALIFAPIGSNGSTVFSTFWGQPWLEGFTGFQTTTTGGGTTQAALLTSGTVNFKMALIATYDDSSTETIFERSSLPGLAVIQIHGKNVRQVEAHAVAAIKLDQVLPSGALAKFDLNFTSCVPQLNKCKPQHEVTTLSLIEGNLAIVALPPLETLELSQSADS